MEGSAVVETITIAHSAAGLVGTWAGNLDLSHSTASGGTMDTGGSGRGVEKHSFGGTVTVGHSILYGDAGGDLINVTGSDVGSVDCTGVNDNLQADPLFDAIYRLTGGSP